jgi:hypothetical protein
MDAKPWPFPWDDVTCSQDDVLGMVFDKSNMGKCVLISCANPHDLVDANGKVIGKPVLAPNGDVVEKAGCGERLMYDCVEGYEPKDGVQPYSDCTDQDPSLDVDGTGVNGFFSKVVGTCVPIVKKCKREDLVTPENAWNPVFFRNTADNLWGNCHDEYHYHHLSAQRAEFQRRQLFNSGDRAVFECLDDFSAIKNKDFFYQTRDVREDESCAAGNKNEWDECRVKQTGTLLNDNEEDNDIAITTNNDKLIARCVDGEWVYPSHSCVCAEEVARRSQWPNFWNFECPAKSEPKPESPATPSPETPGSPTGFDNFIMQKGMCLSIGQFQKPNGDFYPVFNIKSRVRFADCESDGPNAWVINEEEGSVCSDSYVPKNKGDKSRWCVGVPVTVANGKKDRAAAALIRVKGNEDMPMEARWMIDSDGNVTNLDGSVRLDAKPRAKNPTVFVQRN